MAEAGNHSSEVGVDLENSAYQVEELSHNHLRFELQDSAYLGFRSLGFRV